MLTGETVHSLDSKNRLFIPAKHREELGESFIIARDIRGQRLNVYSFEKWRDYLAPIYQQERKLSEKVLRYLHRNAAQVTPDSQGRVILPPSLIEFACITGNAVVVGCEDHDEIWAEEIWQAEVASEDPDEIRREMEKFGL